MSYKGYVQTKIVLDEIVSERIEQDSRWGTQNHTPETWLAILTEEVGEVAKAIQEMAFHKVSPANYREELIQVAAVAVAMVECLDRKNK